MFFIFLLILSIHCLYCPAQSSLNKILRISEVFPNPKPSYGLPENEFIEIYNNSDSVINLSGFQISDPTKHLQFPEYDFEPHQFLILCKSSDSILFVKYGSVIGFKSFFSLNNNGDTITITNSSGLAIDEMVYKNDYKNGFSLELTSLEPGCGSYKISENISGGTPGSINSVTVKDTTPIVVEDVALISDNKILLKFNLPISSNISPPDFFIDEGEQQMTYRFSEDNFTEIEVSFYPSLLPGKKYSFNYLNISSCNGAQLANGQKDLILTEPADSLDLVINEILFNPYSGNPDFLEIINRSDKYIDIFDIGIISIKETKQEEIKVKQHFILEPGHIVAFSAEPDMLCLKYPNSEKDNILEFSLPSYNDDSGIIQIQSSSGLVLDRFNYSEEYHSPLLKNIEGVSLERISSDAETNYKDTWMSAASDAGFATPGIKNSNQLQGEIQNMNWDIEPGSFSPNGDGYHDFVSLKYSHTLAGMQSNINIFDSKGRMVKKLFQNNSLSSNGFIVWDGTNEDHVPADPGHYIFAIELFTNNGYTEQIKKTVVVTYP